MIRNCYRDRRKKSTITEADGGWNSKEKENSKITFKAGQRPNKQRIVKIPVRTWLEMIGGSNF